MGRQAIVVALPRDEQVAVTRELTEAGFEVLVVSAPDELEAILATRREVGVAILDGESDFDRSLEFYSLLHDADRDIPALMVVSPRALDRLAGAATKANIDDEFFTRPYSTDSLRWRIEAMLIRSVTIDDGSGPVLQGGGDFQSASWSKRATIVSIFNPKGGVGKTTTAINLAASLAIAERKTLLVDADPQGNATSGVGIDKGSLTKSLYDVLIDGVPASEVVVPDAQLPFLHVLPASQDLVGAELELIAIGERETVLRRALATIRDQYEFILIDCPPSLGLVTLNVLSAADAVVIPIQCEYYALEGISQLLNTIRVVQQNFNPDFQIDGVLLTMYDNRLNLSKQVVAEAREYFGAKVFRTVIPRNVRLAEAPSFGKPILLYDVQSIGAKSYLSVAQELMKRAEAIAKGHDWEAKP